MRHGKKFNHLGRKKGHRRALLANMANSLIEHKRIKTTQAKAKALRKYIEPLLTRGKNDTVHNRRMVFRYLQNKESIKELFDEISNRIAERPGGYTRIIKLPARLGDGAEMCIIELVDYNEDMVKGEKQEKRKRTRRSRGGKKKAEASTQVTETVENVQAETPEVVENVQTETPEAVEDVQDEVTDVADETTENTDENKEDV